MDTKKINDFSVELLELIPVKGNFRERFLNLEELKETLFSLIQGFVKDYSSSDIDDGLEIYTEFYHDVLDCLTLGNSFKIDSLNDKLEKALNDFIKENGLEK